jgi:hypothetical protein
MIGLFVIAIIGFSVGFSQDNNLNSSITDNPHINASYVSINSSLSNFRGDSQNQLQATANETGTIGEDSLILPSLWGAVKTFFATIISIGNALVALPTIVGIPPVITGTIIAIIVVMIIFLAWKVIKVGE